MGDRQLTALDLDCKDGEEKNLDRGSRGVPEGSRDSIGIGDVGGLEQGSGPGPLGDNVTGSESHLDRAASSGEHLRVLHSVRVPVGIESAP